MQHTPVRQRYVVLLRGQHKQSLERRFRHLAALVAARCLQHQLLHTSLVAGLYAGRMRKIHQRARGERLREFAALLDVLGGQVKGERGNRRESHTRENTHANTTTRVRT